MKKGDWKTMSNMTLKIDGKAYPAVYFHKPDEPYGFLSNWWASPFELEGIRFGSAEQ